MGEKTKLSGVISRTIVLDRLVGDYLENHPGAVVVNIACGLDTRCYRVAGYCRWYNLDLPETIAVRAGLMPEASVFVETMNPVMVKRFKEKSIEGSNAKFTWGVKNGEALAQLLPGFELTGEHCLTEGMAEFVPVYRLLDKLPAVRNISNRIVILEKKQ